MRLPRRGQNDAAQWWQIITGRLEEAERRIRENEQIATARKAEVNRAISKHAEQIYTIEQEVSKLKSGLSPKEAAEFVGRLGLMLKATADEMKAKIKREAQNDVW